MIRVVRERGDYRAIQRKLDDVRLDKLQTLRKLVKNGLQNTDEFRKLLDGYQIAKDHLYESQYQKCCYCEKMDERSHNDVEHYRPKSIYWWLAFTWTNLLFACRRCNRSEKNAEFQLKSGDRLKPEEHPSDGNEVPFLLDPSNLQVNPVAHIEFKWKPFLKGGPNQWVAESRNDTEAGVLPSVVYDLLNRGDLFELRGKHVRQHVQPIADDLNRWIGDPLKDGPKNHAEAKLAFPKAMALLEPESVFVAVTYDAFRHLVPNERLKEIRCSWPEPKDVGLARAPQPTRRPAKKSAQTR